MKQQREPTLPPLPQAHTRQSGWLGRTLLLPTALLLQNLLNQALGCSYSLHGSPTKVVLHDVWGQAAPGQMQVRDSAGLAAKLPHTHNVCGSMCEVLTGCQAGFSSDLACVPCCGDAGVSMLHAGTDGSIRSREVDPHGECGGGRI